MKLLDKNTPIDNVLPYRGVWGSPQASAGARTSGARQPELGQPSDGPLAFESESSFAVGAVVLGYGSHVPDYHQKQASCCDRGDRAGGPRVLDRQINLLPEADLRRRRRRNVGVRRTGR